ncbi:hypothetical protein B0J14DRAFT_573628 [Halenospora varia]|nr:hypothetical protein B0J14DRAFT_573628 [Halenospora varia]
MKLFRFLKYTSFVLNTIVAADVGITVRSTILVLATDRNAAFGGYSGLQGYGIPYEVLYVPSDGALLPLLNLSSASANYGAIVVISEVSHAYPSNGSNSTTFKSALSDAQWASLYSYQVSFGVRMVQIGVYPGPKFGTQALGGCCSPDVDQLVYISNITAFPTAGLVVGASVSTRSIWHYPAKVVDFATIKTTTEFAQFSSISGFPSISSAGVINNFKDGRQQMVFHTTLATDWDAGSNFLQHAWIHWATRGLYTGFRRINFGTQVDDMFLQTEIYGPPPQKIFRVSPQDLDIHKLWTSDLNARLPPGSSYSMEIAHNGNGNLIQAWPNSNCTTRPIAYPLQSEPSLEFAKPPSLGTNLWPPSPLAYPYTPNCLLTDPLQAWFTNSSNRNSLLHVSHTFTHENFNNATYFDVNQEIKWNKAWIKDIGLDGNGERFSDAALVPPAITGLHNGDALRAWADNGVRNVVGDNTREVLRNQDNKFWPLITSVANNGYAGMLVVPRWATNIYYNCDVPSCTVTQWQKTSHGDLKGDFSSLLSLEKITNTRNLLGLHRDPFMFHQANLRVTNITLNGVPGQYSMLQAWVETVLGEVGRLVTWPIITLKQDDLATSFLDRMTRDACNPILTYNVDASSKAIVSVTITTDGNLCSKPVPVTIPGGVTSSLGHITEQIGTDPLTIWTVMNGQPVTFNLTTPSIL